MNENLLTKLKYIEKLIASIFKRWVNEKKKKLLSVLLITTVYSWIN